jgi:hypothetical protein
LAAAVNFGTTGAGFPGRRVSHQQPQQSTDNDQSCSDQQVRRHIANAADKARSEEGRQGGAAHTGAEDSSRKAASRGLEPGVNERDADSERRARQTKEEAEHQEQRVGPQRAREGHQ